MRGNSSRRQRRSDTEMRRWLQRRSSHGWTWSELSRRSGIPRSTLMWWSRRLRGRPSREKASDQGFVQGDLAMLAGRKPVAYHLRLDSGHELSLESGFVLEEVRSLLRALAELGAR